MIKTILLALIIVMALIVMTQQAKAQPTNEDLRHLRLEIEELHKKLEEVKKCDSAENVTKCKMDVMGWSDQEAIIMLGLNKSK